MLKNNLKNDLNKPQSRINCSMKKWNCPFQGRQWLECSVSVFCIRVYLHHIAIQTDLISLYVHTKAPNRNAYKFRPDVALHSIYSS